jgi:hypothetical protein
MLIAKRYAWFHDLRNDEQAPAHFSVMCLRHYDMLILLRDDTIVLFLQQREEWPHH